MFKESLDIYLFARLMSRRIHPIYYVSDFVKRLPPDEYDVVFSNIRDFVYDKAYLAISFQLDDAVIDESFEIDDFREILQETLYDIAEEIVKSDIFKVSSEEDHDAAICGCCEGILEAYSDCMEDPVWNMSQFELLRV